MSSRCFYIPTGAGQIGDPENSACFADDKPIANLPLVASSRGVVTADMSAPALRKQDRGTWMVVQPLLRIIRKVSVGSTLPTVFPLIPSVTCFVGALSTST